ncbi:MAG: dicarboxylate/amino acid:cation symporter [Bryobacterales bacterium]|nr:dicarboxylate/amino acid:cation symporter [Bryobacterales bacterium]
MLFRISLAWWILIAGAAGIVFGFAAPQWAKECVVLSNIFLRLIQSIIAPVLFGVLVRALGEAGELRSLGRLGWKSMVLFEVTTTIALLLGWCAVAIFEPGRGIALQVNAPPQAAQAAFATAIESVFPASIIDAMARGNVLQIVVFCLLFGLAVNTAGSRGRPVLAFANALAEAAFAYTRYVMYLAPFAVAAAMAATVAGSGTGALQGLARFVALAYAAQLLFLIVVLGGLLTLARVPLRAFAAAAREPFLVAFATTSSAAALPATLEHMERFGVPKRVLGFAAPLSLSLNLTGSTIHLAMCTLFVAQAAAMELSWGQQLALLATLKITSKGVAGIPRANFVILAGLFASHGLPAEGLTMLLGIDAIIDMMRTSVNVVGHCAAGPILAAWEPEPPQPLSPA